MSNVNVISARRSSVDPTQSRPAASDKKVFTRTPFEMATVVVKDKAVICSASLARELESLFPNAGVYGFNCQGEQCRVKRFAISNNLQVLGPNGQFATILNGSIVDQNGSESAISSLLSAARGAVPG